MIVFLLSGLWHGASWNFVIWGGLNGLFLIIFDRFIPHTDKGLKRILPAIFVSTMWALSLVFFRLHSFQEAIEVFRNLGVGNSELLYNFGLNSTELKLSFYLIIGIMIFEILKEKYQTSIYQKFISRHLTFRWSIYLLLVLGILFLGSYGIDVNDNSFIYFQF